ncbi:MAG TPA: ComEC/Rec2 family competence protein [Rhizomicrobium sp.]|jgi:competence protein ComEC
MARVWSWLATSFRAERERYVLWLPVGLAAGVALYFAVPVEPAVALSIGIGVAGVLVGIAGALSPHVAVKAVLSLTAALAIGFVAAKASAERAAAPVIAHRSGPMAMEGRVEDAQAHGKGVRVTLTLTSAGHLVANEIPHRVRVSIRSGGEKLVPGDWIRIKAVLLPPPSPTVPGAYDFGRAAFFQGLGGVGYSYGGPQTIAAPREATWNERARLAVEQLRWRMTQRIHSVLPRSTGAIAAALITGDRGGISEEDDQALRDAGLAHVLAIAGLHMALVGFSLFWAVRALLALFPSIALNWPIKKWAAVAALGGAAFYLIISGGAPATVRAFIMLATMLSAILFDRPALSMRSVALAATIILLAEPESLIGPSFQMSFAAVIGLVAVAEWEQKRAAARTEFSTLPFPTVRRYLRGIATTSFVGSIATLPFAAFHFDRATHYAVLGNLGAMPIMGFVTMPAAALSVILMPFGLDAWPLKVMGWGIDAMLAVGSWVSHLPGAVSVVSAWPVAALLVLSFGGLWMALWRGNWRWLGLVPLFGGIAMALLAKPPDVLISRDATTIAVRTGAGKLVILPGATDEYSASDWLKRDGDERIADAAFATAADGAKCDALGCTMRAPNGMLLAASARPDSLAEDCAVAQIVISAVPTRHRCTGPKLVIDRFDVSRNGAYAIWLGPGSQGDAIRVRTVREERGDRLWSPAPRAHPFDKAPSTGG